MAKRPSKRPRWVKKVDRMLNDAQSPRKRRFDIFIAALVLFSVGLLFVGGLFQEEGYRPPLWATVVDTIILVIFLGEYLARLAFVKPDLPVVVNLSRERWLRYHIQARIAWMFTPLAIIDLLAVLPLFTLSHTLVNFKLIRVLRILRLMRLYRLFAVFDPLEKLGRAFRKNSLIYLVVFAVVGVSIVMGSIALYALEGGSNANVRSPFDAVWWAIVTLTTVGYGDTIPTSFPGKMVAIALMLGGMILLAVLAGVMSQTMVGYLLDVREERVRMSTTSNHFIICGWNSRGSMVAEELKHLAEDEEIIVFANMDEPPDIPSGISFVRGNPTKQAEWDKVRLSVATNVVVLAPPTTGNANSVTSDGYTALVVYTVRSFERGLPDQGIDRNVPLHVSAELLDPENSEHISTAGADEVVHTVQVGSNLIAHSSVKPGMGRVVNELISWWGQGIDLEPLPADVAESIDFQSLSLRFKKSHGYLVMGVMAPDGGIFLNPPDSHPVKPQSRLVVIRDRDLSDN